MGLDMRQLRIMLFGVKGFQQNRAVNGRARKAGRCRFTLSNPR